MEARRLRAGHYLNQFFAGISGEERADTPPAIKEGAVGPGRAIQALLGPHGAVVSTMVCGDNYFNERLDAAAEAVEGWLREQRPDVVIAGPAFAAGRYGRACVEVCRIAADFDIPAVTGMHPENPGLLMYRQAYVVPTAGNAAGMTQALNVMVPLARKLGARRPIGPAAEEGYLPRGIRRPGMRARPGAERAVDILVAKLTGQPFLTELPVAGYEAVAPAPPVADLAHATIAVVTTGAIVPKGNPDHLKRCSETRWRRYELGGRRRLTPDDFECVHGGFYNVPASQNPNVVLPLDALRDLEDRGTFARLADFYCTTTGNDQRFADCVRNGKEIAALLWQERIDGVLLVAT
jgi:glycine/betaine/sarcosine/D-proline reductase family selenoprotein B